MRIINGNEKVLKGWPTIAQGKRRRSVALGLRTGEIIVRAKDNKIKITVSDER